MQEGEFLLREPEGWAPFRAIEIFTAHPPGFLWDARIRMAPFLTVRVRDGYARGVGSMRGAVGGLLTVVRAAGTPEMAEVSLQRFLAEAAWFPDRLRPSSTLAWRPVDGRSAIAALTDRGLTVAARFRFDSDGDIVEVQVPDRPRGVRGGFVRTPWVGRFWEHHPIGGVRIPARGEVAWVIDGEERPYWRGRIIAARYERG